MEETSPQGNHKRWMLISIIITLSMVATILVTSWRSARDVSPAPDSGSAAAPEGSRVSGASQQPEPQVRPYGNDDEIPPDANILEITDSAYTPNTITIPKGTTVYFVNKSANERWPASALHPTHTIYPNSDISKCGTPDASTIFDACRGLKQGEYWAFTFNETGAWRFHDHLRPSLNGTITVQ